MRGRVDGQGAMFFSFSPDGLVPETHPLRGVKRLADQVLARLQPRFAGAYAATGRPSIPPEQLLKALLLQALYSIRSERQLCEQIGYNLLYRWFLDLSPEAPVWDPTTFTKNRERFAAHGLIQAFFEGSVGAGLQAAVVDREHFSVDGSLIQSWASLKSVQSKAPAGGAPPVPPDGNAWGGFTGERRTNDTHASRTDPEALLARRADGQGAHLSHSLHTLMENRHGLCLDISVAAATNQSERAQALVMCRRVRRRHGLRPRTLGADKGYDAGPFLHTLEARLGIVPHVATRDGPMRARDAAGEARRRARRRQRTVGYRVSQRARKLTEQIIGWVKGVAGLKRTRFVGRWRTALAAYTAGTAYNLLRLARLQPG